MIVSLFERVKSQFGRDDRHGQEKERKYLHALFKKNRYPRSFVQSTLRNCKANRKKRKEGTSDEKKKKEPKDRIVLPCVKSVGEQIKSSVYSFSSSCPKTVSRTREVFPTGSTTLLRLQLSRTRDCAHRSRHVGLLVFLFFFLLERKVPAQSKLKE